MCKSELNAVDNSRVREIIHLNINYDSGSDKMARNALET